MICRTRLLDKDKNVLHDNRGYACFADIPYRYSKLVLDGKFPKFIQYLPHYHQCSKEEVDKFLSLVKRTKFFCDVIEIRSEEKPYEFLIDISEQYFRILSSLTLLRYPEEFPQIVTAFFQCGDEWIDFIRCHQEFAECSWYNSEHLLYTSSDIRESARYDTTGSFIEFKKVDFEKFPKPSDVVSKFTHTLMERQSSEVKINASFRGDFIQKEENRK